MWISAVLAAGALLLGQTLTVIVLSALRPKANIYATIIVVAFLTAPAAVFAAELICGRPLAADGRLFLVLVHLALGGFLFHFITLPDRSVTLRMLVELERAPGHRLALPVLSQRYSVRAMIASRLDQLADGQFIALTPDGTLTLKPRGERFGRFVTGGRRLFRITSAN